VALSDFHKKIGEFLLNEKIGHAIFLSQPGTQVGMEIQLLRK